MASPHNPFDNENGVCAYESLAGLNKTVHFVRSVLELGSSKGSFTILLWDQQDI